MITLHYTFSRIVPGDIGEAPPKFGEINAAVLSKFDFLVIGTHGRLLRILSS